MAVHASFLLRPAMPSTSSLLQEPDALQVPEPVCTQPMNTRCCHLAFRDKLMSKHALVNQHPYPEDALTTTFPPAPPLPPSGGLKTPFLLLLHTLSQPAPPVPALARTVTCVGADYTSVLSQPHETYIRLFEEGAPCRLASCPGPCQHFQSQPLALRRDLVQPLLWPLISAKNLQNMVGNGEAAAAPATFTT